MQEATDPDVIVDYITGLTVPNLGAEANRQRVERYLVEQKGYRRADVRIDAPIDVEIADAVYRSTVDLVVQIDGRPLMAIKCAAGSLGSREREIIAAARIFDPFPLPLAAVSDGITATLLDVATGQKIGDGLAAIPNRTKALELSQTQPLPRLAADRLAKEKLIFRSYDSMNVNVHRRKER